MSHRVEKLEVKAGCFVCDGGAKVTKWDGNNALAVAARHNKLTGHATWAEQFLCLEYGQREIDTNKDQMGLFG